MFQALSGPKPHCFARAEKIPLYEIFKCRTDPAAGRAHAWFALSEPLETFKRNQSYSQMRPESKALFLEGIRCAGGVAFVVRDCRDVLRALGEAQGP